MFFTQAVVALAATVFFSTSSAHMIMLTPTPFNNETIDNSPLEETGSNYPCKSTGSADFYDSTGISNPMVVGQENTLSFRGSAVHGGGSCQLALTTDMAPTANTSWDVILSIIGGCPSTTGDGPSTYQFTIPDSVAPGNYVFAWTWISKLAGQPEYYMNCAPVQISAASSKLKKRSIQKTRRSSSLPQLGVFNLQSVNSCKSTPGTDPEYPNPGSTVQKPAGDRNYGTIAGSNCVPLGQTDDSVPLSGSGSAATSAAAGGASAAPSSPAVSAASASAPVASVSTPATSAASPPAAVSTLAEASSAPEASSPAAAAPSEAPSEAPSPASSSSIVATPAPTSAATAAPSVAASTPAAVSPSAAASTPAAAASATAASGSGGSGSSGALTGPCSDEGMWNCIGGTSFQRCASGQWSVTQPVAPGTSCTSGQSENFDKRGLRYHRPALWARGN